MVTTVFIIRYKDGALGPVFYEDKMQALAQAQRVPGSQVLTFKEV